MDSSITMKYCGKCGQTKELNQFHKDIHGKQSVRAECKSCRSKKKTKISLGEEIKQKNTIIEEQKQAIQSLEIKIISLENSIRELGDRDVNLAKRFHELSERVDKICS